METNYSDDIYGRAKVKSSEELEIYYKELQDMDTGALWTVANDIEPWEPHTISAPMFWSYEKLRPFVLEAARLVTPGEAGRRVVYLQNKNRIKEKAAVGLLYAGIQITQPGEFTPAHRHAASALRFIMEGAKGYTIVDGNKIELGVRDFVITPNSAWHEHGVEKDGQTCIWLDGLDIPMINAFEANDYAVLEEEAGGQDLVVAENYSPMSYSGAGVIPIDREWDKPYSPLFKYSWENTQKALQNLAQVSEGTAYDAYIMRYANPLTGGHPMLTMGATMQMLKPGQKTKAHKHTGSFVFQVAQGQGYVIIDGIKYEFKEKDTFCIPSWLYHEFANTSETEELYLFSFNDLPTVEKLGFYQEKVHPEGHQQLK